MEEDGAVDVDGEHEGDEGEGNCCEGCEHAPHLPLSHSRLLANMLSLAKPSKYDRKSEVINSGQRHPNQQHRLPLLTIQLIRKLRPTTHNLPVPSIPRAPSRPHSSLPLPDPKILRRQDRECEKKEEAVS